MIGIITGGRPTERSVWAPWPAAGCVRRAHVERHGAPVHGFGMGPGKRVVRAIDEVGPRLRGSDPEDVSLLVEGDPGEKGLIEHVLAVRALGGPAYVRVELDATSPRSWIVELPPRLLREIHPFAGAADFETGPSPLIIPKGPAPAVDLDPKGVGGPAGIDQLPAELRRECEGPRIAEGRIRNDRRQVVVEMVPQGLTGLLEERLGDRIRAKKPDPLRE